MAFHGDKQASPGSWVELSNGEDIAGPVRVQNISSTSVILQATAGSTAPTSRAGGITLQPGWTHEGELATYFPGVASAARLWMYAYASGAASVSYG